MVKLSILAGGFSEFIATYVFDSDARSLALTAQNPTGNNPSWIASARNNASVLYAVNEIGPEGNLQSFTVDADGLLTLVDTVGTGGNGPTFTEQFTTGEVSALNFGSPNASFISVDPNDPAKFVQGQEGAVVNFPVDEGSPSNPHQSFEFNGEVFVPDLGADKIWRLTKADGAGFAVTGQIDVEPGCGPRHMAIRENLIFLVCEKTSVLTVLPIPEAPNGPTVAPIASISTVPTLPASFNGSFFAAEIVISEPTEAFPLPLIYISNRNLGPDVDRDGDTIAIINFTGFTPTSDPAPAPASTETPNVEARAAAEHRQYLRRFARGLAEPLRRRQAPNPTRVCRPSTTSSVPSGSTTGTPAAPTTTPVTGELVLLDQVKTGLQQIRGFAIGNVADGGNAFLVAGANTVGGVAVFERVQEGRSLELVVRNDELQNRTSFVFLPGVEL